MEATIRAGGPLDAAGTLARFRLWGDDLVNRLGDGAFRRAVCVDGRWHGYEVRWRDAGEAPAITVRVAGRRPVRVMEVAGFYRTAGADRVLALLVPRLYGLRPTLTPRPFEMLVGSVCAQQVNLT